MTPCGVECTPFPHAKCVWGADAQYGVAGCRALGVWLVVVLTHSRIRFVISAMLLRGCAHCAGSTRGQHHTFRPIYTHKYSLCGPSWRMGAH